MKLDFTGKELIVGADVVFMQIGYRTLLKGTIVSISEKKCTISHEPTNTGQTKTSQFHNQVVLV